MAVEVAAEEAELARAVAVAAGRRSRGPVEAAVEIGPSPRDQVAVRGIFGLREAVNRSQRHARLVVEVEVAVCRLAVEGTVLRSVLIFPVADRAAEAAEGCRALAAVAAIGRRRDRVAEEEAFRAVAACGPVDLIARAAVIDRTDLRPVLAEEEAAVTSPAFGRIHPEVDFVPVATDGRRDLAVLAKAAVGSTIDLADLAKAAVASQIDLGGPAKAEAASPIYPAVLARAAVERNGGRATTRVHRVPGRVAVGRSGDPMAAYGRITVQFDPIAQSGPIVQTRLIGGIAGTTFTITT